MMRPISELSESELSSWLKSFDAVLCDCDGVLYRGREAIDGAPECINALVTAKKKIVYVTNNASLTRQSNAEKLRSLGFPVEDDDHVITAGFLAAAFLAKERKVYKAYVLGGLGITQELDKFGIEHTSDSYDETESENIREVMTSVVAEMDPEVNAVIVGYDRRISFKKIAKAANYLTRNESCKFLASDEDKTFPASFGLHLPGTGSILASIEVASGKAAFICGKPGTFALDIIRDLFPGDFQDRRRILMIGDRCDSDILFGRNCGFGSTLLVGSGTHDLEDVKRFIVAGQDQLVPDFYAGSLKEFYAFIESSLDRS